MSGVIFLETLRRNWRYMLWWGIGIGFIAWINVVALPDVDSIRQVAELMESMPPFMLQMFGAGDLEFMATPEGYLALQLFSFFPLILAMYAVTVGLNVISNEEERGIMDVLLSHPVTRVQIVVEKTVAYALLSVGVILIMWLWVVIGLAMVPEVSAGVDGGELLIAHLAMIPLLWIVLGFTVLLTGIMRKRTLAIALVASFILGSYFLNTIGAAASETVLSTLKPLSYFAHLDSYSIFTGTGQYGGLIVVVVVSVIFAAIGLFGFTRRDVGV